MNSTTIKPATKVPTKYGEADETVWRSPDNLTSILHHWDDDFRIETENPEVGQKLKRLTGVDRVSYCVFGGYQETFEMKWSKLRSASVQRALKTTVSEPECEYAGSGIKK